MSRTRAHRPPWANFTDPGVWFETHDHRNGPCDLVALARWGRLERHETRALRCGWELNWHAIAPACGCRMCTDHVERRAERRRDRHRCAEVLRRQDWAEGLD